MKALFLDFDGVVNDYGPNSDERLLLRHEKFLMVDDILQACSDDVHLVISSTWRYSQNLGSFRFWIQRLGCWHWADMSMTEEITQAADDPIIWEGGECFHFRGVEIDEWLSRHPEVDGYVILDDDCDFFPHQKPFHVCPNTFTGLSEENKQQAIEIFKGME